MNEKLFDHICKLLKTWRAYRGYLQAYQLRSQLKRNCISEESKSTNRGDTISQSKIVHPGCVSEIILGHSICDGPIRGRAAACELCICVTVNQGHSATTIHTTTLQLRRLFRRDCLPGQPNHLKRVTTHNRILSTPDRETATADAFREMLLIYIEYFT